MAGKEATREAYGRALAELGEKYDFVVLDADLAAATKTGVFKKKFPERFFDCGIAEGNMMSVAAGIAATGKIPFVSSFAMFVAGRAWEQVRNSVGYPHLNVKIGATHAGITVGEDGATHQCNEDIALMRTVPGMTILNPADSNEAYLAVEAALKMDGPCYLRFGRFAVPTVTDGEDKTVFAFACGDIRKSGKNGGFLRLCEIVCFDTAAAEHQIKGIRLFHFVFLTCERYKYGIFLIVNQEHGVRKLERCLAADGGTPIFAAADGRIILSEYYGGYGYCVMIDHGDGVVSLYGHMSSFADYWAGDYVIAGDVIGYVGTTGTSTGNHLHFETRYYGDYTSPWNYL